MSDGDVEPRSLSTEQAQYETGDWRWWPQILVRSAGFPAGGVERLRAADLAGRADSLTEPVAAPDRARGEFAEHYDAAWMRIGAELHDIAASSRVREALLWQNPRFLETAVEPLLRRERMVAQRTARRRRWELAIATYWQRYCVKNDSIGFFGPIAWGSLEADMPWTTATPGPSLVRGCSVQIESWAIDCVANELCRDLGLHPWLRPRRAPWLRVDGGAVVSPGDRRFDVDPTLAVVLDLADGTLPAQEIARRVLERSEACETADDVYSAIALLRDRRWLVWNGDVPVSPDPEAGLRRVLEGVDDPTPRRAALVKLSELEDARGRVAAALGDAPRLEQELRLLDTRFEAIAGTSSTRNPGRAYAARTIAYHDCTRAIELAVGRDVADALRPVELMLESARWLTFEIAQAMTPLLHKRYRHLAATPGLRVSAADIWFACLPLFRDAVPGVVDDLIRELQHRWQELLGYRPTDRRVDREASTLEDVARRTFYAPHSGWSEARYSSIDVMIAAADVAAIRRSELTVVLGEIHVALNTLGYNFALAQHPSAAAVWRCVDRDFPTPRLLVILPKEKPPRIVARSRPALARPSDFQLAVLHDMVDAERSRLVRSADVFVEEDRDGPAIHLDGSRFPLIDVFAPLLTELVFDRFAIAPPAPHVPRMTIDRVVAVRETWHVESQSAAWAGLADADTRYLGSRHWLRELRLPRCVFVKSPLEAKPFYVDFDSPVYVEVLAKAVRNVIASDCDEPITLVEMLPTAEDAWLPDSAGNRYTSELRFVAFDTRRHDVRGSDLKRTGARSIAARRSSAV